MAQKTAVEWLVDYLGIKEKYLNSDIPIYAIIDQAKEMQRWDIKDAYKKGYKDSDMGFFEDSEQYYKEIYGGDK